jgi:hypothetical protein
MKQGKRWFGRERLNEIALFLLLLACYIYTFPRWADPNQNSRLDMIVAIVEDSTFQIDKYVDNTVDYAKIGEHYYSDKAPGASFLGVPVYAGLKLFLDLPLLDGLMDRLSNNKAFQATLREDGSGIFKQKVRFALAQVMLAFMISALPSALIGVLMYRLLARFTTIGWLRVGVVFGYALLTPAFAYAGAFYGHQLSAALLFGAFYLVFTRLNPLLQPESSGQVTRNSKCETLRLLLVGLLLGYSVITEYPSVLAVGILYLYTLYALYRLGDWRQIGWVTLMGTLIAAGWMTYNKAIFGAPLTLGYSYSELWAEQHHTGFMSLTMPRWEAIWGITFGVFRGLFILSPWLLVSMPGFVLWWRSGEHRPEFWVAVASVLAMFLFNSSSIMWWGGFAVGPRYLLPMLPFMSLATIFVFRKWRSRWWFRGLIILLFSWSLIATWGVTLAEQAFPSDTIRNPLLEYAWPNWRVGNIARNFGTVLGFPGLWSLLPLVVLLLLVGVSWWLLSRRSPGSFSSEVSSWPGTPKQISESG